MKLYYLSNSTIPSSAANSIHVMHMCYAFAQAGHDVTLFAGKGPKIPKDLFAHYGVPECFELVRLPRPEMPVIKSAAYGLSVAQRMRSMATPDLLYARDPITLWFCRHHCCPLIYEAHSGAGRLRGVIERQLFRCPNFSHLVVISEALRQTYMFSAKGQQSSLPIIVAHDGALEAGDVPCTKLDSRPGALRVAYIGQLYAGKGAEIVEKLAAETPQHDFHLIGGRPRDVATLEQRSGSLSNLVVHGFVPPSQVAGLRAAMDVLVAPYQCRVAGAGGGDISRWMSPLKIFEYMSAAKAIAASDLPVLCEVLEHERNCLLVEPDNIEAWCVAIQRLEDPELRRRLGAAARLQFNQEHTWNKRAETVLQCLMREKEAA